MLFLENYPIIREGLRSAMSSPRAACSPVEGCSLHTGNLSLCW